MNKPKQTTEPEGQLASSLAPESQTQANSISREKGESMKKVHFVLQGKGGIGKSFVSTLIAQYIQRQDQDVLCLDTDPINATFSSFPTLNVRSITLLEANNTINERRFDDMMEEIFESDSNVVVDNGAASFTPYPVT